MVTLTCDRRTVPAHPAFIRRTSSTINSLDCRCRPVGACNEYFTPRAWRAVGGGDSLPARPRPVVLIMGAIPAGDHLGERVQYVITLASASVPMPLHVPFVHELIGFSVFRSRAVEDGRERFRLQLGYFGSKALAQEALGVVRRYYPTAWIVTAPRSGLGSLDDTLNAEFQMLRSATARVVRREDLTLPSSSTTNDASAASVPASDAPPATEPQRYVVQLGWWTQPLTAAAMPRLPVFRAYHLYSVRTMRGGIPHQGIRLGFFKNVSGARQVAEHIRSHYPRVGVVPVSYREYARVQDVLQQRARHALAVVKSQSGQPAKGNPAAEPLGGRQPVTGPAPPPPRARLPVALPSQSQSQSQSQSGTRNRQLILPELGDLKLGKPHNYPGNGAVIDELQIVNRFLDLLAPPGP